MSSSSKGILGILNLKKHSKLGELLIFIESLKIKKLEENDFLDLTIYSNVQNDFYKNCLILLHNYLDINIENEFTNKKDLDQFIDKNKTKYRTIFPPQESDNNLINYLDSTKHIQDFFFNKKYIPYLVSQNKDLIQKITLFIENFGKNKFIVTVHLKNSSNKINESNANQKEWLEFFNYYYKLNSNVLFFLIGDDQISSQIVSSPNVIQLSKHLTFVEQLTLIEKSDLFIGMCSGPFQIALFNDVPYIVFKNPEHHKEEMIKEIGDKNHYSFARKNQYILRKQETFKILLDNFTKIIGGLKK